MGNLRALRTLELRFCGGIKELPASIGILGLQTLALYACNHIKKLPDTVGRLYSLENLTVSLLRNYGVASVHLRPKDVAHVRA